uniref:hypothetical protein n=1 Tax=Actinokineospora sp. CA-119265 TaxID=3239890 RepID=UPI003F4936FB
MQAFYPDPSPTSPAITQPEVLNQPPQPRALHVVTETDSAGARAGARARIPAVVNPGPQPDEHRPDEQDAVLVEQFETPVQAPPADVVDQHTPPVDVVHQDDVDQADTPTGDPVEDPAGRAWREQAQRLRQWARPPDVVAEPPPTWEQLRWRGAHGDQVAREGWTRAAAQAWTLGVTLPVRALVIWLDWIARCPSRTAVAVVLYTLLAHLPIGAWLLPWPEFLP